MIGFEPSEGVETARYFIFGSSNPPQAHKMRHNLSLANQLISHWIPGAVKVVFFLAVIIKLFCNTLQKSFRSLHVPKIASRYLGS